VVGEEGAKSFERKGRKSESMGDNLRQKEGIIALICNTSISLYPYRPIAI